MNISHESPPRPPVWMAYAVAITFGTGDEYFQTIVPDLGGCGATGQTMDEALQNTRNVVQLHLSKLEPDAVPLPLPIGAHILNPAYAACTWALVPVRK